MIMRWISDVPSKMVKLVEVRAVSAGRRRDSHAHVSTNSARYLAHCRLVPLCAMEETSGSLEERTFRQTARNWTWKSPGNISTRLSFSEMAFRLRQVQRLTVSGEAPSAALTALSLLARLPGRRGADSDRSPNG
jgi:hypothetical protein